MNVLFTNQDQLTTNGSTYKSVIGFCEGKEVYVMEVTGKTNYVNIRYKNAASKAWRGTGKFFDNFDLALSNYKCSKIKSIISSAKDYFNV